MRSEPSRKHATEGAFLRVLACFVGPIALSQDHDSQALYVNYVTTLTLAEPADPAARENRLSITRDRRALFF